MMQAHFKSFGGSDSVGSLMEDHEQEKSHCQESQTRKPAKPTHAPAQRLAKSPEEGKPHSEEYQTPKLAKLIHPPALRLTGGAEKKKPYSEGP